MPTPGPTPSKWFLTSDFAATDYRMYMATEFRTLARVAEKNGDSDRAEELESAAEDAEYESEQAWIDEGPHYNPPVGEIGRGGV